ncbi:MAG: transposase [Rhodospirillaceae bacterium]|nr:transposase [Rhodospirillaceae bacterium]
MDRTSCQEFSPNQLRVLLTAAAYVLMQELRLRAAGTACARAHVPWPRDRLKLGVQVVRSVRRVVLRLPRATPDLAAWRHIAFALWGTRRVAARRAPHRWLTEPANRPQQAKCALSSPAAPVITSIPGATTLPRAVEDLQGTAHRSLPAIRDRIRFRRRLPGAESRSP